MTKARRGMVKKILLAIALVLVLGVGGVVWYLLPPAAKPAHAEQVARFQAAMGKEPGLVPRTQLGPDDGLIITGTLDGRQFYVAIPKNWNGEGIVFADGYTMPGTPTTRKWNLIEPTAKGWMRSFYQRGFAMAASSYDKSGLAVESGVRNTLRLADFLEHLGAKPVYAIGGSMGGSITVNMLQQRSRPYAGALAMCGVTGSWSSEIGGLIDIRAVYEYFTRGSKYQMPGNQNITENVLNPIPPTLLNFAQPVWGAMQMKRMLGPVIALFRAAEKNPQGPEAKMIHSIAQAANVHEDFISFGWPLVTIGLGIEDMKATLGGLPYDNTTKVYHADSLSVDENDAMNQGIQRVQASLSAIAAAARWDATGVFDTPLVTLHNEIDSLVPFSQENELKAAVERAHNTALLLQLTVPPEKWAGKEYPSGLTHCGFTADQVSDAFEKTVNFSAAHDASRTTK